ncbi:hypothetical protein BV20DRAFT_1034932 [Pilatotrama ljubarskyi]|nr:hypothetical protein BV20DRAFT_1034932 [Pilatotrama ljubarskyi]
MSSGEDEEDIPMPLSRSRAPSPSIPTTQSIPDASQPIPLDYGVTPPPALKRHRLDVPARVQQAEKRTELLQSYREALEAVEKIIRSKHHSFKGGDHGLQATCARSIQSFLQIVLNNNRTLTDASERAAESNGFAPRWGGRLVRRWAKAWTIHRELLVSLRGKHVKAYSLLDDPAIRTELCAYMRSNKWSMSPAKLTEFSLGKMVPAAAEEYLHLLVKVEMPTGLQRYMEVALLPRISLRTARCWLHHEGFRYLAHKKSLKGKSWVPDGEYPLKKKGVRRGIHRSDVICSTLFVKQLKEKIIPAFEAAHGPGFQALIMVDNSQGHSAYSEDALLTSRMNLRPGGKQARMRDGWYMWDGVRIMQPMVFPPDHPKYPDAPKGMKQRFLRENCDYTFSTLQENLPCALASVSVELIRKWEHRLRRWMDAYGSGLSSKAAQDQVKAFSSRCYKSHRRIPESLARLLDA